jgi:hypothetical protein
MTSYRLYFIDRTGSIAGRDDFDAGDDDEARRIAGILSEACSDICPSFELWQATRTVQTAGPQHSPSETELTQRIQESVARHEETIQGSKWRIAQSRRLIARMDAWRSRFNLPKAR